jgi:hypothetical protein
MKVKVWRLVVSLGREGLLLVVGSEESGLLNSGPMAARPDLTLVKKR